MRRRNVKNAHQRLLDNAHIFIIEPSLNKGKWNQVFNNNNPIHIEIGMGKGDFLIELAKKNPNINYIGIEKYESVIIQAVDKAKNLNLNNLYLICQDASNLQDIFENSEIDKIYLNFSDPWPKTRHEKRRLTSSNFLNVYQVICKKPVIIEFKTDNQGLFEYSLISFNKNNYDFIDLSLDLHAKQEDVVMTEYEKKFHAMGHPIYYVKVCMKG